MNWTHIEIGHGLEVKTIVSCFEAEGDTSFSFDGEAHDFWELLYVESGELSVTADDRIYSLGKNEIIFHKPMELHKFKIEKDARYFVTSFTLSGDAAEKLQNLTCRLSTEQSRLFGMMTDKLRISTFEPKDSNRNYLDALISDSVFLQEFATLLELFLLSFIHSNTSISAPISSKDAVIFGQAIELLKTHISDWISVNELCAGLKVSATALKRIFSKYSGFPIHKYFLQLKIIRATELLERGCTVSQVADELGFSSQNYFSMVFKRETGKSPSETKKKRPEA